jgi:hypothetical protein
LGGELKTYLKALFSKSPLDSLDVVSNAKSALWALLLGGAFVLYAFSTFLYRLFGYIGNSSTMFGGQFGSAFDDLYGLLGGGGGRPPFFESVRPVGIFLETLFYVALFACVAIILHLILKRGGGMLSALKIAAGSSAFLMMYSAVRIALFFTAFISGSFFGNFFAVLFTVAMIGCFLFMFKAFERSDNNPGKLIYPFILTVFGSQFVYELLQLAFNEIPA